MNDVGGDCRSRVWTHPDWQVQKWGVWQRKIACSHVFGLFMRSSPLALMGIREPVPIVDAGIDALGFYRVCPIRGLRPLRHHSFHTCKLQPCIINDAL